MTNPYPAMPQETADVSQDVGRINALQRRVSHARQRLNRVLRQTSLPLLRFSLGLVFIWFGALKVAGITPVRELVAETMPLLDPGWFVPVLGWFEVVLGLALMVGYRLGWVCAAMVAHLAGTFLTLVMEPSAMFQRGNPLMLTMEGEFVAKNLVLITAALVIASWPRSHRRSSAAGAEPTMAASGGAHTHRR